MGLDLYRYHATANTALGVTVVVALVALSAGWPLVLAPLAWGLMLVVAAWRDASGPRR